VLTFIDRPDSIPPGMQDPKHGGVVDTPIVIHQDGKNYLHDGHHRVTAARLMGDKDIQARYVDFDQKG
jgi:ParB-like chromosome segregation protein Spo0J